MITVTAFKWVPPFAQGLSRDLRVRWALEEAGLPYRLRQIDFPDQDSPEHRARQPFGQVPVLDDDGLVLFESGAIVLHIAEKSPALLPLDPAARPGPPPGSSPRSTPWSRWSRDLPRLTFPCRRALGPRPATPGGSRGLPEARRLAAWLGGRDWLEDHFTAGDLMMATVLQILRHTDLVAREPAVHAYLARCTARPAFLRAHRDHMAAFEKRSA